MIPGIDVSVWDGDKAHVRALDWNAYSWAFTFIKVSEGLYIDPLFPRQWAAARGHTLRGAYHYFRANIDPKRSVEKVLQYLGNDPGELPLALDLEETDGVSNILDRVKTWLSWYEEWTGVRPIIYSRIGFLRDELKCANYPYLSNYRLWIAEYLFDKIEPASARVQRLRDVLSGARLFAFPVPPSPFKSDAIRFMQWTALGTPDMVPGYYTGLDGKKEIDINFYIGSRQELMDEFTISPLPEPDEGEPMTSYIYSITPTSGNGSKVRSDHITGTGNEIAGLPYGRFAYGNEKWTASVSDSNHRAGDVWLKVLEVNGKVLDNPGWIAEIHMGTRYATIKQINTPPVEPPPTDPPPTGNIVITQTFSSEGWSVAGAVVNGDTVTTTLKPK